MSSSHVPLQVITKLSAPPATSPKWKNWDFKLTFYKDREDGRIAVHVVDMKNVLEYEESPSFSTNATLQEISALANDLELRWTGYSNKRTGQRYEARALAAIGRDIFDLLFPSSTGDPNSLENLLVRAIRDAAETWLGNWKSGKENPERPPALTIGINSQSLHLPWNLLYPFDDFDQYDEKGFLGIFCSIEETSNFQYDVRTPKTKTWGKAKPVEVSLQLDLRLESWIHDRVSDHFAEYGKGSIAASTRSESKAFLEALRKKVVSEEIIYFCCHTLEDPPQLQLTDPDPISSIQIRKWVKQADLRQWPIIFLNTCRGTLASGRYRISFVEAFINGGAVAVIGAEAEIDKNYAAAYATEFFHRLFAVGSNPESLGDVAYRARLALWSQEPHLSGLLYSVYSRTPVRFDQIEFMRKEVVGVQNTPPKTDQGGKLGQ